MRYRKRPIEVDAVQWTGDNVDDVVALTGPENFERLDERPSDDPEATARVYDRLHSSWVLVRVDDWIIRGVRGEVYPCRSDVFEATYAPVDGPISGRTVGPWPVPRS